MADLNLRTPNGYDGQPATIHKMGIVRLATPQEAIEGTSNRIAVTPDALTDRLASPGTIGGVTPGIVRTTGLRVVEGPNAKQGTAVLVAGTVVVANTSVTATSRIFLTAQSLGTVTAPSALAVSARSAGVSFTILASQLTDTSTVAYEIFEPA